MPRRPPTSGYARIAQAEEEEEEDPYHDDEHDHRTTTGDDVDDDNAQYAPIQPKRRERMSTLPGNQSPKSPRSPRHRRQRTNSGVDIGAINARFERWADEIANKFHIRKVKGKTSEEEQLEVNSSVFQAPDWIRPVTENSLSDRTRDDGEERLSKVDFDDMVESVRVAIELGMHPKLISQGSSGSYFARNSEGKVLGVFKPKDEEPYASRNPKWTKWIHRNLFPFFFGRACLIPNLSYISEAAAYVLDCRLQTNIVPYTDVVALSSKSFFYDFWERRAYYRKKKPLAEKLGSFQVFLKGYKDATLFLKEHPWPDQVNSGFRTDAAQKKTRRRWAEDCRPRQDPDYDEDDHENEEADDTNTNFPRRQRSTQRGFWTEELQQSFREQLERLVILDYIMRNTDRGLDNWMIRIDQENQRASIVIDPPKKDSPEGHTPRDLADGIAEPYTRPEGMSASAQSSRLSNPFVAAPQVRLGAIDNSLSWPWKHPDAWRSYPFGWLFLPVSLIGRPFSEATKHHFLPLLTSKHWWRETQMALRKCFERDSDFSEKMYARQIAVMKGQAWNVVETLKTKDHGPLELCRRARVCVWDDIVEIPVVVPMQRPSEEQRRKRNNLPARHGIAEEDEMDISTALGQNNHDLLGISEAANSAPLGNRFNISRQHSTNDARLSEEENGPLSPSSINEFTFDVAKESRLGARPVPTRSRTRLSMEEPRRLFDNLGERKRRFSLGISRRSPLNPYDQDDLEGDLGYAAAEGQEGNMRKVIVERLETVKSKNPTFTWC